MTMTWNQLAEEMAKTASKHRFSINQETETKKATGKLIIELKAEGRLPEDFDNDKLQYGVSMTAEATIVSVSMSSLGFAVKYEK